MRPDRESFSPSFPMSRSSRLDLMLIGLKELLFQKKNRSQGNKMKSKKMKPGKTGNIKKKK